MSGRFKNYGFWTALISSVFIALQAFGIKINAPYVNEIITAILGVLVVLGIISNPKDGAGFGDSKANKSPNAAENADSENSNCESANSENVNAELLQVSKKVDCENREKDN